MWHYNPGEARFEPRVLLPKGINLKFELHTIFDGYRYTGPTLLSVIDNFKCPERPVNKPFRFSVNDIFKGTGSNFCVSGHVETGMVATGDRVLVLPHNEIAVVKGFIYFTLELHYFLNQLY